MAKKITNTESEAVEHPDLQPENTEQPAPAPEQPQEIPETPEPAPEPEPEPKKKAETKETTPAIPEYADRILKRLTSYPELYIDPQGGTFTVDSPPAFRSTATLHKNPYYKRP